MQKEKRLVVISPGWGNSTINLRILEKNFQDQGFDVAIVPNITTGIRDSAMQLAGVLQKARQEYSHISFVGYSMGGLVGRYAIHKFPGVHNIDSYTSISTPHAGSALADFARWSKTANDMKRDSEFLKEMEDSEWPLQVPALAIQAHVDEMVIPISSTILKHAENIMIPRTTHLTVVMSDRTFFEIHSWLCSIFFPDDFHIAPTSKGLSYRLKSLL